MTPLNSSLCNVRRRSVILVGKCLNRSDFSYYLHSLWLAYELRKALFHLNIAVALETSAVCRWRGSMWLQSVDRALILALTLA